VRRAAIRTNYDRAETALAAIAAYMPGNYDVIEARFEQDGIGWVVFIEGEDNAGWTLDDYVLPRLASGFYFGREVDATVPIEEVRID
jgi:hypothetical protein